MMWLAIGDITSQGNISAALRFFISPQACGYLASLLVFLTFWMRRIVPLRLVAICSNIAFFAYAVMLGLTPIAILHASLFPVNLWRLWQLRGFASPSQTEHPSDFGRSAKRYLATGASIIGASLIMMLGAIGAVHDGAIHCRAEKWRDWSPACRQIAEKALSLSIGDSQGQSGPRAVLRWSGREEFDKLIRAASRKPNGHRDTLIIAMAYRNGISPSDLSNLRWDEISLSGSILRIHQPGRVGRKTYALSDEEVQQLQWLRRQKGRSRFVFASAEGRQIWPKQIDRIIERARLEARVPSTLEPGMLQRSASRNLILR